MDRKSFKLYNSAGYLTDYIHISMHDNPTRALTSYKIKLKDISTVKTTRNYLRH